MFFTVVEKKKTKNKNIRKKSWAALGLSVFLVVVFAVMQALEIKSATDTEVVTITTTVAETISLSCTTPVALGTLTPGTPVLNSDVCTTTTNAESGYDLAVRRDTAGATLTHTDTTTTISDKTTWDPTAGSGAGNAETWTGTGLGFRVFASTATKNDTWWGAGTSCDNVNIATDKYAGIPPTTYTNIMQHAAYSSGSTTTSLCYKLDVPSAQKSGDYSGTITFQATSQP